MYGCESWTVKKAECWKNWCFWTVVLEKTLESPLDCKEIQPVHPQWNQSWIFIRRTDAEAEAPILWPPDAKDWLIEKVPDAGKDWKWEEKGTAEDEMVGWHHRHNGHEFGWTPRVGDGQGGLVCCHPWGCKDSDMTEQLNYLLPLLHFYTPSRLTGTPNGFMGIYFFGLFVYLHSYPSSFLSPMSYFIFFISRIPRHHSLFWKFFH